LHPPCPFEEAKMNDSVQATAPFIEIDAELCKGCKLCVGVCPKGVIDISEKLNGSSYHPAYYLGRDCTGCALCFYACPEPAAIKVVKP
jgi:NAD-dependent dihydropyrimidine dehydrogenase PreA subunit